MSSRASTLSAVIAAAGSGERLGAGGPKAFVPLGGRPLVEWSIDAFRACERVGSIVVAAPPGHVGELAGHPDLEVVAGGATRARSVAKALEAVSGELVAIHDAARPLLTPALVEALAEVLDANPDADGVIAAAPVADTVKRAGWSRTTFHGSSAEKVVVAVGETLDRSSLWSAQTPQLFRAAALREALAVDAAARDAATDEAMLIEAAGGTVLLHDPGAPNFKVTTPADLKLAELLLTERP